MLLLEMDRLEGALSMREAIDLLETAARHEDAGATVVSPRLNTNFDGGWMRILFAVDKASGYFATKAYHMIQGTGVRYVVSLYALKDGSLIAMIDGRAITDLRTGAASGVVARQVPIAGPVEIGIIGSGYQARTQLASLAAVYNVVSAAVYSPTAANRERFAREMSAQLGFEVSAAASAEAAVNGKAVVAAASSNTSREPAVRGEWLTQCRLLCAVGSTRAEQTEADLRCFTDAELIVVDTPRATEDSGDLKAASLAGVLSEAKFKTVAQLVAGKIALPARGMVVFKSIGTALQDLALAAAYYERLRDVPGIAHGVDVASLKPKP